MIIDTSAVIAILDREPEAQVFGEAMAGAVARRMSTASFVELAAVIDGRHDALATSTLDSILGALRIELTPFSAGQAQIAREAYQRFGRGSGHPARLNLGDCFSYALARDTREPLLFKGRDFALSDIELVTEPVKHRRLSEIVAAYLAEGDTGSGPDTGASGGRAPVRSATA